jgi:hypothetical protein
LLGFGLNSEQWDFPTFRDRVTLYCNFFRVSLPAQMQIGPAPSRSAWELIHQLR